MANNITIGIAPDIDVNGLASLFANKPTRLRTVWVANSNKRHYVETKKRRNCIFVKSDKRFSLYFD